MEANNNQTLTLHKKKRRNLMMKHQKVSFKIAIVGFGSIGSLLYEALIADTFQSSDIIIVTRRKDIDTSSFQNRTLNPLITSRVTVTQNLSFALRESDIVFLCVLPSQLQYLDFRIENEPTMNSEQDLNVLEKLLNRKNLNVDKNKSWGLTKRSTTLFVSYLSGVPRQKIVQTVHSDLVITLQLSYQQKSRLQFSQVTNIRRNIKEVLQNGLFVTFSSPHASMDDERMFEYNLRSSTPNLTQSPSDQKNFEQKNENNIIFEEYIASNIFSTSSPTQSPQSPISQNSQSPRSNKKSKNNKNSSKLKENKNEQINTNIKYTNLWIRDQFYPTMLNYITQQLQLYNTIIPLQHAVIMAIDQTLGYHVSLKNVEKIWQEHNEHIRGNAIDFWTSHATLNELILREIKRQIIKKKNLESKINERRDHIGKDVILINPSEYENMNIIDNEDNKQTITREELKLYITNLKEDEQPELIFESLPESSTSLSARIMSDSFIQREFLNFYQELVYLSKA